MRGASVGRLPRRGPAGTSGDTDLDEDGVHIEGSDKRPEVKNGEYGEPVRNILTKGMGVVLVGGGMDYCLQGRVSWRKGLRRVV